MQPLPYRDVRLTTGLLAHRQRTNTRKTIPAEYHQIKSTGRIDVWRLCTNPNLKGLPTPHIFWGSDVAKWVEAVAYSVALEPNPRLEEQVDEFVDLLGDAQHKDGYLNLFFTVNAPGKRWTNLRDDHELYGAGHLIEAAVAYAEATGKRKLLDILSRYVDLIAARFGPGDNQIHGYDGHPEIELALVRLYRFTGDPAHLKLARFFIDERGKQPCFFAVEAAERKEDPAKAHWIKGNFRYYQAHLPIRQQTTAEGHAVRWGYLFAGAVDVAAETGDKQLLNAAKKVFDNVVNKRMYVHGGIGPQHHGEQFTFDYDLGNEDAYAETCAQISLVFLAHRLLHADLNARYADIIERCLYNSILSGVSLDGTRFYYDNYMASYPGWHELARRNSPDRQEWFGCSCCPPNVARLLGSVGGYLYSSGDSQIFVHLYAGSTATFSLGGVPVQVQQTTDYPWDETIDLQVNPEQPADFALSLRIPAWCNEATITLNGQPVKPVIRNGYATIRRRWNRNDRIRLTLAMPVERVYANPKVRHDVGRVAVMRGPILYCLEQVDNGADLNALALPKNAKFAIKHEPRLLGGVTSLTAKGQRLTSQDNALYTTCPPKPKPATLKFIPYHTWANRKSGEMLVWLRES